ncbi:1773_t:CDS:1 [Funneliformis geosporum]|uniref:10921_t:CDS:1 n=1 Tax=Funneliformis geosporum TaxID=1117311 RepID=A0A9W4SXT5_9GLOM|nr:10921_t:CDS:1 [Funneliformis geosporum]CAI2184936.1 1773_t:CDS:1 [Funneliformis geosporum]
MEVDLCFVMDCTGSMAGHINAAKACILRVAAHMETFKPSVTIRFGFCGYRDHCDGVNRLQIFPFTDSKVHFERDLSTVSAMGGGDSPEDVLGGLNAAVNQMSWRNKVRIIFHIGDCPPHGTRYKNSDDSYPNGDPYGLTAESVLGEMKSKQIFYFFGKITEQTNEMINIFRGIIGEFPVYLLNTVNTEVLVNKFFESTCSVIETAISLIE